MQSEIIKQIKKITDDLLKVATPDSSSGKGTGGMKTKIDCRKDSGKFGVKTFIMNGTKLNLICEAVRGKSVGTEFFRIKSYNRGNHG
jgi:glutamate 5-kinase